MLVLAMTLILMGIFIFYVRQKLFIFESRLELMSETIQTMAGVTRAALQEDSDESESESESDGSETDEDLDQVVFEEPRHPTPDRVMVSDDDVKKISLPENDHGELEVKKMTNITYDFMPDSSDPIDLSTPEIDKEFDSLTLKELKDKVAECNGPKLKTKKELIDFLQKIKSNPSV